MCATSTKQNREFKVKEADGVEILSLVDNSVDFLSAVNKQQVQSFRQWKRERDGKEWGATHMDLPFAEHGFSVLIRVFSGDKSSCVLFDTGGSPMGMVENAERMNINLSEVECIVLSHGHYDHFGGLAAAVKAVGKTDLPIIVHENMFKTRGSTNAKGKVRQYPDFPTEAELNPARLVSTKQPSLTADGMVCVTGEIPRRTSFETGYTQHKAFVSGAWKSDPLIMDERAVAVNIKGKGLVVLSGCAHAGIINTVTYAQQITGTKKVHAVLGGFHLAGKTFENRIQPTIEELQRINPELIVPSHCTGWKAMCTIAKTFPEAFVWNSVGNLYKI
ncbi:MBL fold metallo-hydrolase [Candidatus Bathyarchaeota archaeon]|nr:MBL fold metallo-hydrolase [Candidatus Bathyarchaeota archaeon]